MAMRQFERSSTTSYTRTVCCADIYRTELAGQHPDGSPRYAMISTPTLWGKKISPGDLVLIDPTRRPQEGDWVHVREGIFDTQFKEYPCEEKVLGVIIDHVPEEREESGWSAEVILDNGQELPIGTVYVCRYDDSLAHNAAWRDANELADHVSANGQPVSEVRAYMTEFNKTRYNVVFFPGPGEQPA